MNILKHPELIANYMTKILHEKFVIRPLVTLDISQSFAGFQGQTVTVRKRKALEGEDFDRDKGIQVQDIVEEGIPVTLDRLADVSVSVTAEQKTLELEDFGAQVLEPAATGLASKIEKELAAFLVQNAKEAVEVDPDKNDLGVFSDLGNELDLAFAPDEERYCVLSTKHKHKYATAQNLSNVSWAGNEDTLRNIKLGMIYGLETFSTQAMPYSSAKVPGDATSYKVKGTKGESKVALSSVTDVSGTVKAGDGFIVDGRWYKFTQDKQASGGAITTINVTPKLHKTISTLENVIMVNKPISVAFHKDAIAFVNRPLTNPEGAVKAYTASANGISVRVVVDYDINTKEDIISFDILYGIAALRPEHIVKLA